MLVGQVFAYFWDHQESYCQDVSHIAGQLDQLSLILESINFAHANVRRKTDPAGTERYQAQLAEWSEDEVYRLYFREPWHIYVGKIISTEGLGSESGINRRIIELETLANALQEVKLDLPEAKIIHCTSLYVEGNPDLFPDLPVPKRRKFLTRFLHYSKL